jgi:pentapeptide MXKDX repeat protein
MRWKELCHPRARRQLVSILAQHIDDAPIGTHVGWATYRGRINPTEMLMKKILIATAALTLMCGSAFAQSTTQQDNMNKPGMTNGSMDKGGAMDKGSMNKGTTGTSMKKDGMSDSSMSKDGMKNDSMNKGGMTK